MRTLILMTMSSANSHSPNFFILGAGKSGTTSLYYFLRQHPEIFMSDVKEPTFFSQGFQVIETEEDYFQLFDAVEQETVVGEASHVYMSNPSSAETLKELFPGAKFLVVLRDPVDRVYSLYHHMCRAGYEGSASFERALEAEEQRANSEEFKKNCPQYLYNFFYYRSGLYGQQLQRYFSLFDKAQFHILTTDELRTEPLSALKKIFEFLNVNSEFQPTLELQNQGQDIPMFPATLQFWHECVTRPEFIRKLGIKMLRRGFVKKIPPMCITTRQALKQRYGADLDLLNELTGISF